MSDLSGATQEGSAQDLAVHNDTLGDKYLRLDVPNYDHKTGSAVHPRTYLQMGSYPTGGSEKERGDDLLTLVGLTTSTSQYFKDDYRKAHGFQHGGTVYYRDDGTPASARASTSDPVALTSELRTRGGWRQHTDGNHVSTTRGDRVDVIFGNYKMVVLGRLNAPAGDWGETYWESSGGHTRWATNTQGDMVLVEWNDTRNTWRTYDETLKGHSISRFQGIVDEIYECRTMHSYIGYDGDVTASHAGGPVIPTSSVTDPHTQTDQATTWINPGSGPGSGRPRHKECPDVDEDVKAKKIEETTKVTSAMGPTSPDRIDLDAGNIRGRAFVIEKKEDKTYATGGTVRDDVKCDAGVSITSQMGFAPTDPVDKSTAIRVGHYNSLQFTAGKFSSEVYGFKDAKGIGGWTFNLNLVAVTIDLSVGLVAFTLPNFIGAADPSPWPPFSGDGPNRHEFGLNLGLTCEFAAAAVAFELNVGAKVNLKLADKLEGHAGSSLELNLLKLHIAANRKTVDVVENRADGADMTVEGNLLKS
jgi:hypothetical protein